MAEAEWKTRKERIDKWLKSLPLPWEIVRYKDGLDTSVLAHHAVEEFSTDNELASHVSLDAVCFNEG